jgi:protein subunit release factor B
MEKQNGYWKVKFIHSSGHGGQHKDHGNSKAQLSFDVAKFFEDYDEDNTRWDKFVEVFGKKNIHHNNTVVVLENQEQRSAKVNEETVLKHLRHMLSEVLEDEIERIETKVPKIEKKKRVDDKKHH